MAKKKEEKFAEGTSNSAIADYLLTLFKEFGANRKQLRENEWQKNYDAFKAIYSDKWRKKAQEKKSEKDEWKADVFLRLTSQIVMGVFSMLSELMFQGGQIPFMLKPIEDDYQPDYLKMAEESAKKQTKKIRGQLTEARIDTEMMKGLLSLPMYGDWWMKCPDYKEITVKSWKKVNYGNNGNQNLDRYERNVETRKIPCATYRSVWDMFPDMENDDIQEGRGMFDRQMTNSYALRKLKDEDGFYGEAIDRVIAKSDKQSNVKDTESFAPGKREITKTKNNIRHLIFAGRIPTKLFDDWEKKEGKKTTEIFDYSWDVSDGDEKEVIIHMADEEAIAVFDNEGDRRPYLHCPMEKVLDELCGISTAENLRDSQTVMNSATNIYLNNAAFSGNVILGVVRSLIAQGKKLDQITPGMIIDLIEDADAGKAIQPIIIPNVGAQLEPIIDRFERYAHDNAKFPKFMQGDVMEKRKPDTLGELTMLTENTGKYGAQVTRNIDEYIIEPMIETIYDYNMSQPGMDETYGSFKVHALGFSTYQIKIVKVQSLKQFLSVILLAPEVMLPKIKIEPILEGIGKGYDLDPEEIIKSDEEQQQDAMNQQQQLMEQQQMMEREKQDQIALQEKMEDDKLERDMVKEEHKASIESKKKGEEFGLGLAKEMLTPKKEKEKAA